MKQFSEWFEAITGHSPFQWQTRLFSIMKTGVIPQICHIPTGLGKTSVIPIWLLALVHQIGQEQEQSLPRRLVYIVNRRTVVDQATTIIESIRERLSNPDDERWSLHVESLQTIASLLGQISSFDNEPLAISTLRGELADNEEWKVDPSRAAIIAGTIDMIGSKLLFSGYGDSNKTKPAHAGLIGQDALIIHDEAHLTPAFSRMLDTIKDEQKNGNDIRCFEFMELSATSSRKPDQKVFALDIEHDDKDDTRVIERLQSSKKLEFYDTDNVIDEIVGRCESYQDQACKVLAYVRMPADAKKIEHALRKKVGSKSRIAVLTGTIRGYERDNLVKNDSVYRAFLDHFQKVDQTVFLISTSAGEVGVDFDADHMICDLTPLDSMIQRFGRVNRCGKGHAKIDCIVDKKTNEPSNNTLSDYDRVVQYTRTILETLPLTEDGCRLAGPQHVSQLLHELKDNDRESAFSPSSPSVPLTDIVLDAWSMTSLKEPLPGIPKVAPYLHGLDNSTPETYVVWRAEVETLWNAFKQKPEEKELVREWFLACPIETQERLRERTDIVYKELKALAKTHKETSIPIILLDERFNAKVLTLEKLLTRSKEFLAFQTVVLPVACGGLDTSGMLDGKSKETALDVSEQKENRQKVLLTYKEGFCHITKMVSKEQAEEEQFEPIECDSIRDGIKEFLDDRKMKVANLTPLAIPLDGNDKEEAKYLLLLKQPGKTALSDPESVSLVQQPSVLDHNQRVQEFVDLYCVRLHLPGDLKEALTIAAKWHDTGKDRKVWQQSIYNPNGEAKAKPGPKGMNWHILCGYRHEFGSLLDASNDSTIQNHSEMDLILHLIATHHGWARPHFENKAFDMEKYSTTDNEAMAHETMRRFARLQQKYGRWGLAWLETLLRCADITASKETNAGKGKIS